MTSEHKWRVGDVAEGLQVRVYEGERFITLMRPADAALAVSAVNAAGAEPVGWALPEIVPCTSRFTRNAAVAADWRYLGYVVEPLYAAPIAARPEPAGEVEVTEAMADAAYEELAATYEYDTGPRVDYDTVAPALRAALARRPAETSSVWTDREMRRAKLLSRRICRWSSENFPEDLREAVDELRELSRLKLPAPPSEETGGEQ